MWFWNKYNIRSGILLEINKIHNGDCLKLMNNIDEKSIDMILADLPYGTTACKWDAIIPLDKLWDHYTRIIKETGVIVLTASQPFTTTLIHSNLEMFKYELIWVKSRASDFINANYRPMKKHENILVFSKGGAAPGCKNKMTYNPQGLILKETKKIRKGSLGIGRDRESQQGEYISKAINYPISILEFANEIKTIHPTQKPLSLFEYLIRTYTNEGELVLDNTIGSGTTAIASMNTKRKYIGIELDDKYYELACKRIEDHIKKA
jgi:site-specific DNA-methyltransferase (adenine-specific)